VLLITVFAGVAARAIEPNPNAIEKTNGMLVNAQVNKRKRRMNAKAGFTNHFS
jgi:hypothetical protein